jgi:hypothetical protein
MKWDKTCIPPKAWYVEDGQWVPVDPALVKKCAVCSGWFVAEPVTDSGVCSIGCNLKLAELKKE